MLILILFFSMISYVMIGIVIAGLFHRYEGNFYFKYTYQADDPDAIEKDAIWIVFTWPWIAVIIIGFFSVGLPGCFIYDKIISLVNYIEKR